MMKMNDLARLFQISPQTIRMYESYGILQCARSESNYRILDQEALRVLLRSRLFQQCGFSMSEAARMINELDEQEVIRMYREQISKVEEEIRRLEDCRYTLEHMADSAQEAVTHAGSCHIAQNPALYLFPITDNQKLVPSLPQHLLELWNRFPELRIDCTIVKKENLTSSKSLFQMAMGLDAQRVQDRGLDVSQTIYLPPQRCVVAHATRSGSAHKPLQDTLPPTLEFIRREGLEICGDAIFTRPLLLKRSSEKKVYFTVYIPVK